MKKPTIKFTFKKEPRETGLASVGRPYQDVAIKHEKKIVGYIIAPFWMTKDNLWRIKFAKATEDKMDFTWVNLMKKFKSENEAREFIKENTEKLFEIGLYHFED